MKNEKKTLVRFLETRAAKMQIDISSENILENGLILGHLLDPSIIAVNNKEVFVNNKEVFVNVFKVT